MSADSSDRLDEKVRDGMVRQLRQNLAKCRKVILDEKMELKTRETVDPVLQQHITGAQQGPERQTDARLGEQTARH